MNATHPFMLTFAESYDPLWVARVKLPTGVWREYKSEPIYAIINGFWIEDTGELEIVVEYLPQRWFYIGAGISLLTLLCCLSYLGFEWYRERQRRIKRPNINEHLYTQAILELRHNMKLTEEEAEEYLSRAYNDKDVKLLMKMTRDKKDEKE